MKTVSKVNYPIIVEMNEIASSLSERGKRIFNLGQAIPNINPGFDVIDSLKKLPKENNIHSYCQDNGLLELRKLISENYLANTYNTKNEIIITSGANHAYFISILAVTDPGDEVILISPYYFNHAMALELYSRKKVDVPMIESDHWEIDLDAVKRAITRKTKAITIVNPGNPTGAVIKKNELIKLCNLCVQNNIFLISDEVYCDFIYNSPHFLPAVLFNDNVITIGSLSKTLGIMGWRIGYVAAKKEIIHQILKIQDTSVICASHAGQIIAIDLLKKNAHPSKDCLDSLNTRKQLLFNGLKDISAIKWLEPDGALFACVRLDNKYTPYETAKSLLEKKGVVTIPCETFGKAAQNHLRISFGALEKEDLIESLSLIKDYFDKQ